MVPTVSVSMGKKLLISYPSNGEIIIIFTNPVMSLLMFWSVLDEHPR